jgi:hypothetical protein
MKKILILLLAALCAVSASGQDKQKMAVYVTGDAEEGIKKVLGSKLVAAITQSGDYIAVERTADFLAEIQKEQGYARSGNVDNRQISKLGKQFGVQLVCVADISNVLGTNYASARLIDVETASVIATAEGYSDEEAIKDLVRTSESIASQLIGIPMKESQEIVEVAGSKGSRVSKRVNTKNTTTSSVAVLGEETLFADFKQAEAFCMQSSKDNSDDWRLPTFTELVSIYASNSNHFTLTGWYWSSTCVDKKCKDLVVMSTKNGKRGISPQRKKIAALCIRD